MIVLLARNKERLEKTKSIIASLSPKCVSPHVLSTDLGDLQSLPGVCEELMKFGDPAKHDQFVLINNAGTINSFDKPLIGYTDPNEIQDYFAINYTSMAVLTAKFLSTFQSGQRYVINITTLLATVYIGGFPLYSPSRAARNAFMGVLVAENPDIRAFNYSPGPCGTDMNSSIPRHITEKFPRTLTCEESISKFVSILKEDTFQNASVIDFFD